MGVSSFRCMIIDNISLKHLIRGVKKKDEFINSKKNPHDICRNLSGGGQCGHFQGIGFWNRSQFLFCDGGVESCGNKIQLCLYCHQCTDVAGCVLSGPAFYRTWNCVEPVFYGNYRGKRYAAF